MAKCKCGCDEECKPGNKYINHHYTKDPKNLEVIGQKSSGWHKSHPEGVKERGERHKQWYKDHPEAIEDLKAIQEERWKDPNSRKKESERIHQTYEDHPELRKKVGISVSQFNEEYPENVIERSGRLSQLYEDNPELKERQSAIQQDQDYDAGEWEGFSDNSRSHLKPESQCTRLNKRFSNSAFHHITNSIGVYIPDELHRHIPHCLKTGLNMGKINMVALQFWCGEWYYV